MFYVFSIDHDTHGKLRWFETSEEAREYIRHLREDEGYHADLITLIEGVEVELL